jgi:hypothetical protein
LKKLILVAVICAAPVVLGTAAYFMGWWGTPSNYGELVPPKPLSGFDALRGKWVLVTFDDPACDAYCEKKLYFMRQVRRAQGKDMDRVERLWSLTGGTKPRPELLAAIEGTRIERLKPFDERAVDHIYLVDPMGNLMMRFPRDPDPSKMIKDLQRLLRYTPRPR